MTTSQRTGRVGVLVALGVVLSACGVAGIGSSDPDPDATRLAAWSEATAIDQAQREEWHDPQLRTRLVDTDEEREDAITTLPSSVPTAEVARVRAVGLDESVLVIAVFNRCTETSRLVLDDGALRLVIDRDEGSVCGWAPVQVEAWSASRANLPDPVVFRDQRGDPA